MHIFGGPVPRRIRVATRQIVLAVLLGAIAAGPLAAQGTAERMVDAVRNWAADRGLERVEIAVAQKGRVRAREAPGGPAGPVDIASLSKVITAACVQELVARDLLDWDERVRLYLPETRPPLARVRLADLVTHTGGLTPDSTQDAMPMWRGDGPPVYGRVMAGIARRPLGPHSYTYNNENYAVLAEIIRAASGRPYAETCRDLVLRPAGATSAAPSPAFGRFAAWGGWRMTLADYTRLIWDRFGNADPRSVPHVELGGFVQYGLGTVWRSARGGNGYNFWHFGALCFEDAPGFMTYSVLWSNGWGAAVHIEGCPRDDWFGTLDAALVGAVFR